MTTRSPQQGLPSDPTHRTVSSVAIIVPAYNEEANLPNLFRELEAALAHAEWHHEVIVVDDGSRDGTAALVTGYRGPLSVDLVTQGVNRGLGAAILAGFHRALEDPEVDVVVTIEADTTSDLAILGRMVDTVEAGADLAQGSMHHPEGHMVDVSAFRQLTSRVASAVMRVATGTRLHTFTNLYRAMAADALRTSLARRGDGLITERGFAGVTELLLNMIRDGAQVVEVPIRLDAAKRVDESKMPVWPTVRAQGRVAGKAFLHRASRR